MMLWAIFAAMFGWVLFCAATGRHSHPSSRRPRPGRRRIRGPMTLITACIPGL